MVTDGNNAPWSVKRNSSRPDGYLVLKETEEGVKRRGKEKEKRSPELMDEKKDASQAV